jgi:ribosomal protein S18 acetylase RimI-like enzyme
LGVRKHFRILPLGQVNTDKMAFDCGVLALNRYFKEQVGQDIKRRVTACFVAVTPIDEIAGYYTLALASCLLEKLPSGLAQKLPRYPSMPAVRMGRLAVDVRYRGQGLGGVFLVDALKRSTSSEIAACALLVDAKDQAVVAFYEHFGFIKFAAKTKALFLPLARFTA